MVIEIDTGKGYDQWAPHYESDGNPMIGMDELAFKKELNISFSDKKLLDLGCGTGRHTVKFAKAGALVTGIDVSIGMINEAKKKDSSEKIEFITHDLSTKIPKSDNKYDIVISSLVLEHIKDLEFFFSEIKRVSKSDSYIFITAMHPSLMLLDIQANFKDPESGKEICPKGYPNQISDFVNSINNSGLKLDKVKEYFCTEDFIRNFPRADRFKNWPMLISFTLSHNKK